MPRNDPEFSARVHTALETVKRLTLKFTGRHSWFGVIPGDIIDPEILAYLEDEETGVLTRRGLLPAKTLASEDGRQVIEYYLHQGGPELVDGMIIYEIRIDFADLTAMAAGECNISRFVAGRE